MTCLVVYTYVTVTEATPSGGGFSEVTDTSIRSKPSTPHCSVQFRGGAQCGWGQTFDPAHI